MVTVQKLFQKFAPDFIKRIVDPVTASIDTFVESSFSELEPGHLVLDAGAGECRFRDKLKGDPQYIAVDATWGEEQWDYSRIDVISHLENLPFASCMFDSVICTQVLEHVSEPKLVLYELSRILKEGGMICLTAPQGWGVHQPPHDYFRFTNYGLSYLLQNSGFEEITITPSCGYFGYLANRLTVIPKILFWQLRNKWMRIVLFPLEIVSYLLFVVLFPVILNAIDFLDHRQDYTLNYLVKGRKKIGWKKPNG
jgi:SAM-dependent methyltransferase